MCICVQISLASPNLKKHATVMFAFTEDSGKNGLRVRYSAFGYMH